MIKTHSIYTSKIWFIYIIKTNDNKLYTGITKDIDKRFKLHSTNRGAKFLRNKGPLQLVFVSNNVYTYKEAIVLERYIKKLTRAQKIQIIQKKTHTHI